MKPPRHVVFLTYESREHLAQAGPKFLAAFGKSLISSCVLLGSARKGCCEECGAFDHTERSKCAYSRRANSNSHPLNFSQAVTRGTSAPISAAPAASSASGVISGPERRKGECWDFVESGRCKFGEGCKYRHPAKRAAQASSKFSGPNADPIGSRRNSRPAAASHRDILPRRASEPSHAHPGLGLSAESSGSHSGLGLSTQSSGSYSIPLAPVPPVLEAKHPRASPIASASHGVPAVAPQLPAAASGSTAAVAVPPPHDANSRSPVRSRPLTPPVAAASAADLNGGLAPIAAAAADTASASSDQAGLQGSGSAESPSPMPASAGDESLSRGAAAHSAALSGAVVLLHAPVDGGSPSSPSLSQTTQPADDDADPQGEGAASSAPAPAPQPAPGLSRSSSKPKAPKASSWSDETDEQGDDEAVVSAVPASGGSPASVSGHAKERARKAALALKKVASARSHAPFAPATSQAHTRSYHTRRHA